VVAPDSKLLDIGDFGVGLKSKLGKGAVVIKTGHSSEILSWNAWSVVLANQSVGVGWVSDDDGLGSALSMVVDSLAGVDEDLAVILEEVTTFHTGSTGLSANEEVVVNFFKGDLEITGDDNVVEKWEGTVVELGLDTLEGVFGVGKIEQVENDSLVGSKEGTTTNYQRLVIMFFSSNKLTWRF
jgi:hypothetical protein